MTALSPGNVCLQLPADPRDWAIRFLERQGLTVSSITRIGGGTHGEVFRLDVDYNSTTGPDFVVKVFDVSRKHFSAVAVRNEFDVLRRLATGAAHRAAPMACPEPIAIAPSGDAYLMTSMDGKTLDDHLLNGTNHRHTSADLAETIVAALAYFYDVIGDCYADFEPGNVLIGDEGVCLLDPLVPNPTFLPARSELRWYPSTADIGYWVEQVAAHAVRQTVQYPRLARARIAFTRELVAAAAAAFAPEDEDAYRAEVVAVADYHIARYRRLIGRRWLVHEFWAPRIARRCALVR